MSVMQVGLLGLGRGGLRLADALLTSSWSELVAVASTKAQRLEQFAARHPEIAAYNDFRSLIVENRLDALFVAVPPYVREKYLPLAAERGLPVWMLTPAARRFEEALAIARAFEEAACPLVVARSWGVEPALQADAMGMEQVGKVFLARGSVMTCWPEDLDWRGDSVRAGGGVLLDSAYTLIDTVVQAMGIPTTVYARAAGASRPESRYPYDTEDTGAVICQFGGGAIAVLSGCGTAGPEQWSLDLYGIGGSIHCDREGVMTCDRAGETILVRQARASNPLLPLVEDFLSCLRTSPARLGCTIDKHLPTMAVVEAAYLSARTGQPESPGRIFDMHDFEPGQKQVP